MRKRKNTSAKRASHRRVEVILTLILIALILLLGILFFRQRMSGVTVTEEEASKQEEAVAKADQETENKGGADLIVETETEEEPDYYNKDIQRDENTATEEHHKTNGLAICMYHNVYDESDPPDDLNTNYIEVHALEEELQYLKENDYYYPTWEEVRAYIDGDLLLPEKSVVLTFDDGNKRFLKLGAPLLEKYEIPATSFMICNGDGEEKVEKYASDYLTFQSHSYNMHRDGGDIGHGGVFTALSVEEGVEDLEKSIEICHNSDAFAYPYGDYTDSCREAVEKAGFLCAVTTENRRAEPGDDPLILPRVRMLEGQSLEGFIYLVE